jgi:hypothetical protein
VIPIVSIQSHVKALRVQSSLQDNQDHLTDRGADCSTSADCRLTLQPLARARSVVGVQSDTRLQPGAYLEFVTPERLERYSAVTSGGLLFRRYSARGLVQQNVRAPLTDRALHGPGLHRCNCAFLDFAHHHRFVPRMCRSYRARPRGSVERMIRYLRASICVPLASQLSRKTDGQSRHCQRPAGTWLREIASTRYATTGELPLVKLERKQT